MFRLDIWVKSTKINFVLKEKPGDQPLKKRKMILFWSGKWWPHLAHILNVKDNEDIKWEEKRAASSSSYKWLND